MKYRVHEWYSVKNEKSSWGIQRQESKGERYRNVSIRVRGILRAAIYSSKDRAEELVRLLNEGHRPNMAPGLVPLSNKSKGGDA